MPATTARPFTTELPGGNIHGLEWGEPGGLPVLALHGWLDNANSFARLGPLLQNVHLRAIDLPGHGKSFHRPPPGSYNIWDDLLDILAIADSFGWQQFALLGHSRGAIISQLLTATMPERIYASALIDGVWPQPLDDAEAPAQIRRYLLEERKQARPLSTMSLQTAVLARQKAMTLSDEAARLLVERGTRELADGQYSWSSDPRLRQASAVKFNEKHNEAFLAAISRPVCVVLATEGYAQVPGVKECLETNPMLAHHTIAGSHHLHMETAASDVAALLNPFFASVKDPT